jgi:diguanylate cyclase (GGDEF)-like protein
MTRVKRGERMAVILLATSVLAGAVFLFAVERVAHVEIFGSQAHIAIVGDPAIEMAADPQDTFSLGDAMEGRIPFKPVTAFPPGAASLVRPLVAWAKFPPHPSWSRRASQWYVAADVEANKATLYWADGQGVYRATHFGMSVPFNDRPAKHIHPTVPIPRSAYQLPMYLRVEYTGDPGVFEIQNENTVLAEDDSDYSLLVVLMFFAGICTTLALANMLVFVFVRERAYLLFSGAMVAAALVVATQAQPYAWQWLWPWASLPYRLGSDLIDFAYFALTIEFGIEFLQLTKIMPRYVVYLRSAVVLYAALDLSLVIFDANLTVNGTLVLQILDDTGATWLSASMLAAGIWAWAKKNELAPFYACSAFAVFCGNLLSTLVNDKQDTYGSLYAFLGIAIAGGLLFAALAFDLERARRAHEDEQQRRIDDASYALKHNALTGLPNRRQAEETLIDLLRGEALSDGHVHGIAYVDIDHFRVVNDTSGHTAGDHLLVAVAERLTQSVRPGDLLTQLGGDHFGIVIRNVRQDELRERAEAIRSAIAQMHFAWGDSTWPLSASIGCAPFTPRSTTPEELLSVVDAACARAKTLGGNVVIFVGDELSAYRARGEMLWVSRISSAFKEDRFRIFAQSVVPLEQPSLNGKHIELLVRMVDQSGNIVEPSHFLPAAERYGLAPQIDRWMFANAVRAMAPHIASRAITSFAVNLAGETLRSDGLIEFVTDHLSESGIRPSAVCFEITETVAASMIGDLRRFMRSMSSLGCRFALDDFGIGSSSLGLLKSLEVDALKIDGSFVRGCHADSVNTAMLEAIQHMASSLGLQTIAEYVTNAREAERLRSMGIDYGQGWYFDAAMPLETILRASERERPFVL